MWSKPDNLKLTQAAAFLLQKHGGSMSRMRLLKLLYIADRELLKQTHRSLTGDRPVAMDHGPVLTHTYDLLKGQATGVDVWNCYIKQGPGYLHALIAEPGVGRLSKLELDKLAEVTQRYWFTEDFELSSLTHDFLEWKRNQPAKGKMCNIRAEDLLEALDLAGESQKIHAEAQADAELDALLGGSGR